MAGANFQAELGHYDWETGIQSIVAAGDYIGSILDRGELGVDAGGDDDLKFGTFADRDAACKAVSERWEKKLRSNGGEASENPRLVAALSYAIERGWEIFTADISLDEKTGKFRKKSYKSAEFSNGAKW